MTDPQVPDSPLETVKNNTTAEDAPVNLQNEPTFAKDGETGERADQPPLYSPEELIKLQWNLYQQRKAWATRINWSDRVNWDMGIDGLSHTMRPRGPWTYNWEFIAPPMARVDPFNPKNMTNSDKMGEEGKQQQHQLPPLDEYDKTIDFGSRRERLRKTFEWELDRLWLAEELQAKEQERRKTGTKGGSDNPKEFARAAVEHVPWERFKELSKVPEKDTVTVNVCVEEPVAKDTKKEYVTTLQGFVRREDPAVASPSQNMRGTFDPSDPSKGMPSRIRISSKILRKIFTKTAGFSESALGIDPSNSWDESVVMCQPYKALISYEKGLIDWRDSLKEKYGNQSTGQDGVEANQVARESSGQGVSPQEPPVEARDRGNRRDGSEVDEASANETRSSSQSEAKENDMTQSRVALGHLESLLKVLEEDIAPRKRYLSDDDCKKVRFSELWHIFQPGTEVITQDDPKQALRVMHLTTTCQHNRHSRGTGMRRESVRDSNGETDSENYGGWRPVSIRCVYIDFDGKRIGPVVKSFKIRRFEGERDVVSLPVYPLRCRPLSKDDFSTPEWDRLQHVPGKDRFRQKLIDRALDFIGVLDVRHLYYMGLTLTTREEVESPVVVDFEAALQAEENKTKFTLPKLQSILLTEAVYGEEDPLEEEIVDKCIEDCCEGDRIPYESFVDATLTTNLIEKLQHPVIPGDRASVAVLPQSWAELKKETVPGGVPAFSDDEKVIMSRRVFAFVLKNRKWADLDVENLSDIQITGNAEGTEAADENNKDPSQPTKTDEAGESQTAMGRLVLEEGYKSMIVSLISQHFRNKESKLSQTEQVDIIRGKGKGLIFLLHGAPGVGKTSTAECVAEMFKKPLFQITCGDLGTTAREVEDALERNFTLASKWGCILLLDEADVFLAARTKDEFKRNGLVAVFLRVLEYYDGVLFLTTNRVGDFDEAFASRIHVSLLYPDLDLIKTRKIFRINLDGILQRFRTSGRSININTDEILRMAEDHFNQNPKAQWNGRQIRNACQTALALAEFDAQGNSHMKGLDADAKVHLKQNHFQSVQEAYLNFTNYMNDVLGSTAARRAKEGKLRAIWLDENDRVVGTQEFSGNSSAAQKSQQFQRTAFPSSPQPPPAVQPAPQGGFQQPLQFANQQQPFMGQGGQTGFTQFNGGGYPAMAGQRGGGFQQSFPIGGQFVMSPAVQQQQQQQGLSQNWGQMGAVGQLDTRGQSPAGAQQPVTPGGQVEQQQQQPPQQQTQFNGQVSGGFAGGLGVFPGGQGQQQ